MKSAVASCLLLLLSACATSQAQPDVPAHIVAPSADSRAELLAVVASVLKADNIKLADDALTTSSALVIERPHPRDAAGRQLSGRDFGKPDHFRLVKAGTRCVLIHQESGARTELQKSHCEPAT